MHRNDGKEKRDHQSSAQLDELVQASKDMQDIRNSYDGLISAAAAMTNSIFEFSESLHEMGTCLLEKTSDVDGEGGRVLSSLGNIQSELQKLADSYRSYVIVTITNPSESLLSELRKVEEMKLQCDEKRGVYEYMMSQHKEKGKLRSGKAETSVAQKLQEAQDDYNEVARLCAFRVKSLKEGQCLSLLTQATRHHAAQLNFFRKGFKALEAVDPFIRTVAEKHRIDCQLTGFDDLNGVEDEGMGSFERIDDGELSFDYGLKKQGVDNFATSSNPMEVDWPHLQVPTLEDRQINNYKHQGDHQIFGRQARGSSYSAPLFPEKVDSYEKPKETQPRHSYVLPPPRTPVASIPQSNPFSKSQQTLTNHHEIHERDPGNDNTSASTPKSTIKDGISNVTSIIHLPAPAPSHSRSGFDSKVAKRQAYSGPLLPTKGFSGRISSASGPISSTELPRSVSPQPLSSPRISELHALPRPPSGCLPLSKSAGGVTGYSGPLVLKNPERSPPSASPLPPPPLVVPRSFSIHSSNPSAMESPQRIEATPKVGADFCFT
ncbi:hypothetical protein L2E82_33198 [Cichorium intybus]|uniref:Uncharacterized protein n=1 Tax=Cichorium intybus TaxID=13427 RepID=A0ACB9BJI9_CICIN|nr:hypothetical protein L2E82_33198 [Cichorium intybus]